MRKVFLRVFFIACFAFSVIGIMPVSSTATETSKVEIVSGEDYTYIKVFIGDVPYILVLDSDGAIADCYPESCGSGSHHGGPL